MHFKDKSGGLHFLSDADIANGGMAMLLSKHPYCVEINDEEVAALSAPSVARIAATRLATINTHASELLAKLSVAYPDGEVKSWPQQTREAEALAVDPTADAPLLTAIATARGVPLGVLGERVRAKVAAYATASGAIIGQRQALEDAINAVDLNATDAAERLEAIQWPA